jgi:hypothetical protein
MSYLKLDCDKLASLQTVLTVHFILNPEKVKGFFYQKLVVKKCDSSMPTITSAATANQSCRRAWQWHATS